MRGGDGPARRSVRFLVTSTCNIRCGFCHNEFQGGPAGDRERRPWDDTAVRALLSGSPPPRVKFSGGEPLVRRPELRRLLTLAREAGVDDITVFTNLTLFDRARAEELRRLGVGRLTVNVPSFDPTGYAERTGQARWPLSTVLANAATARRYGMVVQVNLVLPVLSSEPQVRRLIERELARADRHDDAWDKLAFLADDWGPAPERLRGWVRGALVAAGARELEIHPHRSWEFHRRQKSLLATRCTSWDSAPERADADLYVVPPGRPLGDRVRGRAYR